MRTLPIIILAAALSTSASHVAHAQIPSDLRHFIQSEAKDWGAPGKVDLEYRAVAVHLRTGGEQYIIYWSGPGACGSGGCNMDIIERRGGTFHIITSTTITWLPIRVLNTQTDGWHDIGVIVAGGGINPGYEARLRFDGKKYPSNPTHHASGKTVLTESVPAIPLFP